MTLTLSASGNSISGSCSYNGLHCYDGSANCEFLDSDTVSGTVSGTASGSTINGNFAGSIVSGSCNGNTVNVAFNGSLSGGILAGVLGDNYFTLSGGSGTSPATPPDTTKTLDVRRAQTPMAEIP